MPDRSQPMLATQCSFCQHHNAPGTRFCAECGSPMHLKVCPNPACGKVSDVGAAVCDSCGRSFPKIALVAPATAAAAETAGSVAPVQPAAPAKDKRIPAWPLVVVALVAGGLPLMWANRGELPQPKTWQSNTPHEANAGAAAAVAAPPATAAPAAATIPAPPPAAAAPHETAAPIPPKTADSGGPTPSADTGDNAKKPAPLPAAATAKQVAKAPPTRKAEAPRPCTEAVAALGLCDPKRAGK